MDDMEGRMEDGEMPDLDRDAVWEAVGARDFERAHELLRSAGYDLDDLGDLVRDALDE